MFMKYNDKSVSEIAVQYALLKESLEILRDVRKDKNGAILSYVSGHYINAEKAIDFLQSIPTTLQERLELGKLESELLEFANIPLKLW